MDFEPIRLRDIEWLRVFRNKREIWSNFSNAFLVNEMEQRGWFELQSQDPTKQHFIVKDNEEQIGIVWYDEWDMINRSCRVGISIHPDYQGKGIGANILQRFISYLFADLNLHRIWLLVLDDNARAIKLYKDLGFKLEGVQKEAVWRDNKYKDYLMMGILNDKTIQA